MIRHQKLKYYLLILFQIIPVYLEAAPDCTQWVAKVVSVQGKVEMQYVGNSSWHLAQQGSSLCQGDRIRTQKNSRATLQLSNNSLVSLDQNTSLNFSVAKDKASSWLLDLFKGSAFFRSRELQRMNIHTPFINAVHEGTEFLVTVASGQTEITVFDGQVAATNQQGKIHIKKGFTGIAKKDQVPRVQVLTIRSEDAVQWTLYYPPLIDYQRLKSMQSNVFQPVINTYEQGNTYQALDVLENLSVDKQDANYLILKSSLLLSVGRVDEALKLIIQARTLKKNESTAIALQAVISVAKNRQNEALNLAQKAVTLNPQSAVAKIALSYAYQSSFKIESALRATREAIRLSPDNALAWARLSELQLSTGKRGDALESAKKAQALNPKLSRTQTILGFAYLAEVNIDEAKNTFRKAINLNSSDPLARLGLGLAKIRKGDVEEGTRDIETAVTLAPDNAIMRSYLGKAHYELKNEGYAATELAIAKEMDPKDPTPWYYDAILKQTTNRPQEALHDMQKAIELNDNRAVYRSKLLLDEDLAARTASLARIYDNLGFARLGLLEARKSLNSDPTNYSAHRFLADSASRTSRNKITRVSELLQAQLLQPINTTPVQPHMKETAFSVISNTGSDNFSLNEYNPLFSKNNFNFLASGLYGSNNTIGDEVILSGIYDQFSLSLGQYHFQTDGFRKNDDLEQNVYTAFFQAAISPNLSAQIEFYKEETKAGDVALRFNDQISHEDTLREDIDIETIRFGMNYSMTPNQNTLLSAIYGTRDRSRKDSLIDRKLKEESFSIEMQHLINFEKIKSVLGVSYFYTDSNGRDSEKIFDSVVSTDTNLKHFIAYLYLPYEFDFDLTTTLGLSYDSYDDGNIDVDQLNPKLGLMWTPSSSFTFRASVFRTLKRQLITNQSIEPSQVAGFNQFYDNNQGASAWHYGAGVDIKLTETLFTGAELIWRDVVQPRINDSSFDQNESSHLAYLYWTPFKNTSLSAEYHFDQVSRNIEPNFTLARDVISHSVPLSLNFNHTSGLFTKWTATYVNQDVTIKKGSNDRANASFWTFDASVGYRLPKRYGLISFEVLNLLNRKFQYHNFYDANGIGLSRYVPERQAFITLRLSF